MEEKKVCVICGFEFEGWGNDPWPVMSGGECCDACNWLVVIPARIRNMNKKGED